MLKKDFNLSRHRVRRMAYVSDDQWSLPEKDVKEAVKLLKEGVKEKSHIHPSSQQVVCRLINKIFGDKLT